MENNSKKFKCLKIENDGLYGFEPFFNCFVKIASIHHKSKTIRPCHGYFMPHKYGKLANKYANTINFYFNNN